MTLIDSIDRGNVPAHVAIIMDGNGRWAKKQGFNRIFGHQHGVQAVRETLEAASLLHVKYITLYAFSTENWNRPQEEISSLMKLLLNAISNEKKTLMENQIRLMAIGDIQKLGEEVYRGLQKLIDATSSNQGATLILALNYSGKWDITQATRHIAEDVQSGKLSVSDINESKINSYLATCGIPDPELMIRTSGEYRISNFLLWQLAYAEYYFTPVLWPDFTKEDFFKAVYDYQQRERRFGKTSEQLKG